MIRLMVNWLCDLILRHEGKSRLLSFCVFQMGSVKVYFFRIFKNFIDNSFGFGWSLSKLFRPSCLSIFFEYFVQISECIVGRVFLKLDLIRGKFLNFNSCGFST